MYVHVSICIYVFINELHGVRNILHMCLVCMFKDTTYTS